MANTAIKFLGNTDEVSVCDCCGRKGLKSTVALSIDDGEAVYYGVVCAARALNMDAKLVRSESRKADDARRDREAAERQAAWDARHAVWKAFLAKHGTGPDVFQQIQSLGGMQAAKARFAEVSK